MWYSILADFIATIHFAWVAFVVFGLVFVLLGKWRGWSWVKNRWFRGIHVAMILVVLARTTVLEVCPLSTWEESLLKLAEAEQATRTSFGAFMHLAIHPDTEAVPMWVYPPIYAVYAVLIVAAFWIVPVEWRSRREEEQPIPAPQG